MQRYHSDLLQGRHHPFSSIRSYCDMTLHVGRTGDLTYAIQCAHKRFKLDIWLNQVNASFAGALNHL